MPRKKHHDLIAGLFIVFSSGLFFLLLFLMGTFQSFFHADKEVKVLFQDVQGLRRGEPVLFLGRKIGSVKSLEFATRTEDDPSGSGQKLEMTRVLVTLQMKEEDWSRLKRDSSVVVDKSITGNLQVLIREGASNDFLRTIDEEVLLKGDVFFDVDEAAQKFTGALEKANTILTEVAALLEGLRETGHLGTIFEDIAETTTKLRTEAGPVMNRLKEITNEVQGLLTDNRENVRVAVENVAKSSESFKAFLEKRLEPVADRVEEALASIRETAETLNVAAATNAPRIEEIIRALGVAANNAETLTSEVRRRPWRLLYEPGAAEVETLGLYDAAWAYNLSASALSNSATELASLARVSERVDPALIQRAMEDVEANLKRQHEAEEAFYALLKRRVDEK